MAPCLVRLLGGAGAAWALRVVFLFSGVSASAEPDSLPQPPGVYHHPGTGAAGDDPRRDLGRESRYLEDEDEEEIVVKQGVVFQTKGCPQLISKEEALARTDDSSLPGNVIHLLSEGKGRAGNHFIVVSAYFAMAYCCKSKVLRLPQYDDTLPSAETEEFESHQRFFDFSGVDTMPLEEYEGLSEDPAVCPPVLENEGKEAFFMTHVHPELLQCMNRVYLRGCEAKYLEPLFGAPDFCERPAESRRRLESEGGSGGDGGGGGPTLTMPPEAEAEAAAATLGGGGAGGSAGSLVIHIRSGDIFLPSNAKRLKRDFLGYGQPPLEFYLRAIASQPWSDVSVITFSRRPDTVNPTFAALEMMQRSGLLGPNVVTHKNRDLLVDVQSMLCADGVVMSRSTLHFLTFGHSRARHYFVPSECGPGTYTRKARVKMDGTKKPNPNNTTLMCTERSEAEVYGVEWEVSEEEYGLYNGWQDTDEQLLDMLLFDGIKGLKHCCEH